VRALRRCRFRGIGICRANAHAICDVAGIAGHDDTGPALQLRADQRQLRSQSIGCPKRVEFMLERQAAGIVEILPTAKAEEISRHDHLAIQSGLALEIRTAGRVLRNSLAVMEPRESLPG